MKLVLALECRFIRCKNGGIYSQDGSMAYSFYENRYLKVFDHVHIMARVMDDPTANFPESNRVDGSKVSFISIPHYIGPLQYIKKYLSIRHTVCQNAVPDRAFLLRNGTIACLLAKYLSTKKIPYGVEMVGDPYDVFAPGVVKHPLRPWLRCKLTRDTKRLVGKAACAIYVTKNSLQKRYPTSETAFSTHATDVVLPKEAIAEHPKIFSESKPFRLISVGSLEQMYKAPDIVLRALAKLKQKGIHCHLEWLGDGKFRNEMQIFVDDHKITDEVLFVGTVPSGPAVRKHLDHADLFILVSRTEGLPRALVEAMARGLPCIGSRVGGIPELLDDEALIPVNDADALALKIKEFFTNKELYEKQAAKNLAAVSEFDEAELDRRRMDFYQALKERSENNR